MSELTDDRPDEPLLTSQGGFVYNKPWIDYWEARALKAEAAHRDLLSGKSAVLPQTKEHAEHLYTVAVACLKTYGVDVEADLRAAASTSADEVKPIGWLLDADDPVNWSFWRSAEDVALAAAGGDRSRVTPVVPLALLAEGRTTEAVGVKALAFDNWWSEDGVYIDPDTSDVPWFDKRRELAEAAFLAGVERGTGVWPNFVAPQKYDHPAPGWTDPALPDFRLIWNTARKAGYAVGLHGSMKRDCDLIAVPWTEDAVAAEDLIKRLCIALNASEIGPREPKPNGRIAVNLQIDGYFRLIDLSIVPALTPPTPKVTTDEAEERK